MNYLRNTFGGVDDFVQPLIRQASNLVIVLSGIESALIERVRDGSLAKTTWDCLAQDRASYRLSRIPVGQAVGAFLS